MTQEFMQDAIVEDLRALFQGYKVKNSNGTERAVNVYAQDVPIREGEDETEEADLLPEPYVVVRTAKGNLPDQDQRQEISVILIVCVCDENRDRQGHRDVLHIVNEILRRYGKNDVVGKKYQIKYPIPWETQTEDTHPYYFAAMALTFAAPGIFKEVPET